MSRCARWAREVDLDPAGTAPRCDLFVLVEHPLPWPRDVGDDPFLASLEQVGRERAGAGRTVRLQAVASDRTSTSRRVIVFAATGPPFRGYGRSEGAGTQEELADVVAGLVEGEPPQPSPEVTDVLVCAHGSRDVCCGSLGTRLLADIGPLREGVRMWRTSHTGGHRFAPTALTFPDGCCWAYLDRDVLAGVVTRQLPAETAAAHLRGCAGFAPAVQVADRAAFAARGWSWLEYARFGEERSPQRVELCFEAPDGEHGAYDVCLTEGRSMPVPDCGGDPATAAKWQSELEVSSLRLWS